MKRKENLPSTFIRLFWHRRKQKNFYFIHPKLKVLGLLFLLICLVSGQFLFINSAQAGFGIAPPYVRPKKPLVPGSHYEQKITLLRSNADEILQAQLKVDAPEIKDWISFDKGEIFDLPEGKVQIPMVVKVDVPKNAELGEYKGHINIRIVPKNKPTGAGVAIALGARIDIDLKVADESFFDFVVRTVNIPKIEELSRPWNWPIFSWFFYRIKVVMKIENTGNVKAAPTKVRLDIYSINEKQVLESHEDQSIKKIEPFQTGSVTASFPTKLKAGQYWARVKVYKDKEIIHSSKLTLEILPPGSLPGGPKLGIWPWVMLTGFSLIILAILLALIKIKVWRYGWQIFLIIIWPLRFVVQRAKQAWQRVKIRFWQWLRVKAEKAAGGNSTKEPAIQKNIRSGSNNSLKSQNNESDDAGKSKIIDLKS
jgi:hypothetical protein